MRWLRWGLRGALVGVVIYELPFAWDVIRQLPDSLDAFRESPRFFLIATAIQALVGANIGFLLGVLIGAIIKIYARSGITRNSLESHENQ